MGMSLPIHGSGAQKRGFVYIDDVANAFEIILTRGWCGVEQVSLSSYCFYAI